jgi:putative oxidoreductase
MNMNVRRLPAIALLIGRFLVGGIYIFSGILNLAGISGSIGYAASKGVPMPGILVPLATLIVIAAGISFITGFKPTWGVLAVWMFLLPVTLMMHNFWALEGAERFRELLSFKNNLGLLGGALMLLAIPQPWPWSLQSGIAKLTGKRRSIAIPTTS